MLSGFTSSGFPSASPGLEKFGFKFSSGGAHVSRTMMLAELALVLANVSQGSEIADYREAILRSNVLSKTTNSTRQKSLRHLRELYALDEATPVFGVLRNLYVADTASLPSLALQVAWARDPLLRSTTLPVVNAAEGERVEVASLAQALEAVFPNQYSDLIRNKIARNAASSWTQSGHLAGRSKKIRQRVKPTAKNGLADDALNIASSWRSGRRCTLSVARQSRRTLCPSSSLPILQSLDQPGADQSRNADQKSFHDEPPPDRLREIEQCC